MKFTDKFILKISTQTCLLMDLLKDNRLEISAFEKLNALLDEDFKINPGLLKTNARGIYPAPERKDHEANVIRGLNPFTELMSETIGTSFSEQIAFANRFNQLIKESSLDNNSRATLLFDFYLTGVVSFFHLVSPINLHLSVTTLFITEDSNIDLPNYSFEDTVNKPEFFGRLLKFDAGPLNAIYHVIQFEKSPTELMKFLEFIFSIENIELLADKLTIDEARRIRDDFTNSTERHPHFNTYQHIVGIKLLNEIIYVLEENDHQRRLAGENI